MVEQLSIIPNDSFANAIINKQGPDIYDVCICTCSAVSHAGLQMCIIVIEYGLGRAVRGFAKTALTTS